MERDWETTLPVASRASSGLGTLRLLIIGDGAVTTHELPSFGTVSIGRSDDATLCIHDPSISRSHALLHLGDTLRVEDLGSANGTRVRGKRVGARENLEIAPGDSIEIGTTLLIVQG